MVPFTERYFVEEVQEGPAGDWTAEATCASIGMARWKYVFYMCFIFTSYLLFLHRRKVSDSGDATFAEGAAGDPERKGTGWGGAA